MSGVITSWTVKILTTLLFIVLITMAGCVLAMGMYGARFLSVASDSMAPKIKKSDLVVVLPAAGWPRVGEVISYNSSAIPGEIVTHRVLEINLSRGYLVTKGDNASLSDTPIRGHQVIGTVFWHSTVAGKVVEKLRRPDGLVLGVYLPGFLIITWEIRKLLRKSRGQRRYQLVRF